MYEQKVMMWPCRFFLGYEFENVCLAKETTMHELLSLSGVWISSSDLMIDFDTMLYGDND